MYTKIGAFDAKSKLSELLREIKQGQHYTITLRGFPVADLVPSKGALESLSVTQSVKAMQDMNKVKGVSIEMLDEWIEEGRR